jgi:acetyl-CoA carboxylase carboxyltransferase component
MVPDMSNESRDSSWRVRAEEIDQRRALAKRQGGEAAIAKQHARGRHTIRERIDRMADPGSFREVGPIAGEGDRGDDGTLTFSPANFVLGMAKIAGRPCVIAGEDFTMGAGSPNAAGLRKSIHTEDALRYRVPPVRFHEGAGASITGSGGKKAKTLPGPVFERSRFESIARCLGSVPVASAAVGAVAGFPAGRFVASHYTVMTRGAQILTGGPALVERALGIAMTKEELGGPHIHEKSGLVDDVVEDEAAAFAAIKRFLSYLPQNVWEVATRIAPSSPPENDANQLSGLIPTNRKRTYDMRRVIKAIVDADSFFEIGRRFGPGQIVGLARLDGYCVGIFASDPKHNAGSLTAAGAQKLRRFVDMCQTFHIPIVTLVDEPGFMIGPDAERDATMRHGASALAAVALSTVPWATILVRKSMGLANYAHIAPNSLILAWPSSESGALPVEGGVAIAFRHEIAAAADPAARRAELEDQFAALQSPFRQAEAFAVHDLIHPQETRPRLCEWLELVQPLLLQQLGPPSFSYRP